MDKNNLLNDIQRHKEANQLFTMALIAMERGDLKRAGRLAQLCSDTTDSIEQLIATKHLINLCSANDYESVNQLIHEYTQRGE